jgi:integrase
VICWPTRLRRAGETAVQESSHFLQPGIYPLWQAVRDELIISVGESNYLLEVAKGNRLEAFYVLALNTGMRLGELLGLKWRDLDLEAGTVQIQSSLKKAVSGHALGKPKTAGSRRKVMLTPTAIAALRVHRARQLEERLQSPVWHENDLVFTNSIGNTLCPTNVYRRGFKPLLRRAGLPMIRLHDTRHTAATLLLLSGIHPKVVSEMLGHSSINITLNLYSHVLPDMQASATSAMERLLGG